MPRKAVFGAGVASVYFLFAWAGLLFSDGPGGVAAIWPASGFQMAVFILGGRDRRATAAVSIFLSVLAANLLRGRGIPVSLGFGAANLFEGLFSIWLLDRFGSPVFRFTNFRDAHAFLLFVVMAGAGLAAIPGAAVAHLAFGADFRSAWVGWWLADACGLILVTPFLVEWAAEGGERLRRPNFPRLSEGGIAFLLLFATFLLFVHPATGTDRIHHSYLMTPFLIWIVVRLESLGTVTANLAVASGITFHALGQPDSSGDLLRELFLHSQMFACITSATMLFLCAAFAERRRSERELTLLNESLERQVAERSSIAEEKAKRLALSEQAQRRLVEELKASNDELDAFSSSVAHDLRAPLRAVAGFGLALREDCGERLGDRGTAYLDRIREAVARMESLIDGLMALARVSRSEIRRIGMDLAPLAREIAAELADRQPSRRVAFRVPGHVPVHADPRLLRQLLENLLGNAWKFTARNPDAVVEFGVAGDGVRPLYFVRDNGVGFDMEFAGEMFSPFRRLHPDEEFAGTGIGLATVRRIVSRHGGAIRAEGKPGEGATVYFTLQGGDDMEPGRVES